MENTFRVNYDRIKAEAMKIAAKELRRLRDAPVPCKLLPLEPLRKCNPFSWKVSPVGCGSEAAV